MSKYIVIDLEMCKVPKSRRKGYGYSTETIQIGAVVLNEDYEIIKEFNTYVCPEYGQIDAYIHDLTGISETHIKDAPTMQSALEQFADWIPEGEIFAVSWSRSDENQIRHEIRSKRIHIERIEQLLKTWIDSQKIFSEKMKSNKTYSLAEALIAADISAKEIEHDGLADAYNTALLFAKMQKEEGLTLNKFYASMLEDKTEHLGTSLGDLFAGIVFE